VIVETVASSAAPWSWIGRSAAEQNRSSILAPALLAHVGMGFLTLQPPASISSPVRNSSRETFKMMQQCACNYLRKRKYARSVGL